MSVCRLMFSFFGMVFGSACLASSRVCAGGGSVCCPVFLRACVFLTCHPLQGFLLPACSAVWRRCFPLDYGLRPRLFVVSNRLCLGLKKKNQRGTLITRLLPSRYLWVKLILISGSPGAPKQVKAYTCFRFARGAETSIVCE